MKQGKLIRRAVSAALAGCMMFTLSVPALAESTDALMQLSTAAKSAVSVLDEENDMTAEPAYQRNLNNGSIKVNNKPVTNENYKDILGNGKLWYDDENNVIKSKGRLNGTIIDAPGVDVDLNGGDYSAVINNKLVVSNAHDVTVSSNKFAALGEGAEINCTGKVVINALGQFSNYAIGARSESAGRLVITGATSVEINAPQYDQIVGGLEGIVDITCDGPVTIRGNAKTGEKIANSFTYKRTDRKNYVYYTSEGADEGAIDASVTPIPSDVPYRYLRIEEKQNARIKVNNGTVTVGDTTEAQLDSFKGQKVKVTATGAESDDRKFDGWEVVAPDGFTIDADKLREKSFEFIMPAGEVELTAHHSNRLEVSGGTAAVNDNAVDFARPKADVTVTADDRSAEGYQFDHWVVSSGDIGKTGDDLKANPLKFTMPDAAVKLTAVYRAAVKVSNGTAQVGTENGETVYALEGDTVTVTGHDSNASFSKFVGWKLKKGSLTEITDADDTSLNFKVDAENGYLLDADGEKIKNETIKFTMPGEPVELSAVYSIPAFGLELPVIVEGGTINGTQDSFVRVKAGDKVTIKANTPDDENKQFCYWKVEEGTSEDFGVTVGKLGSETELGTEEITFIMPKGAVRLTAQWSGTPATKPDPDQPLDEDFGVDTPADTGSAAGGAIAAVAVGGAAVWGGYEVVTRVILNELLPEGAAIPANRGQLALLIWTEKGKPEPAGAPAFVDVTDPDMAKAAQWCTEQGTMAAKGDRFEPEGWTPKFKVIEVWNKAFPKK